MLNEKQKQFCNEFIIDFNGTQAAIRAGYSKRSAKQIAFENLTKHDFQAYIKELIENRNKRTGITQDEVVKKIIDVVEVCTQKIEQTDENGETVEKMLDVNGANKALDMLMKHTGGYNADNKQKTTNVTVNNNVIDDVLKKIKDL